jgi:hypothetical protein
MSRFRTFAAGTAGAAAAWALVLAGAAGAAGPDAAARQDRVLERAIPVGNAQEVRVQFSYGQLSIEPGDGDQVKLELSLRCKRDGERCTRQLDDIDFVVDTRDGEIDVRVDHLPKFNTRGVSAKLRVFVPQHQRLVVEMGAGEIRISDLAHDVNIQLGAGEIDIHMPEDAVRSVALQAGVGDAHLRRGRGKIETARAHLIGASVRWDEGRGQARVEAQVGAGEVQLCLD